MILPPPPLPQSVEDNQYLLDLAFKTTQDNKGRNNIYFVVGSS